MDIIIPNEIVNATKMSADDLKLEIAIMLYKQEKISSGRACKWLGINLIDFRQELGKRGLTINYDVEDFESDLKTLRSLGRI
ncbi:UPF0175 family protein [Nostoc piscinale]|uniref:UPF0175 family protein n=1 Tax=Nostoc piscinale TaxID=224012 RepID=UPI0039A42F92